MIPNMCTSLHNPWYLGGAQCERVLGSHRYIHRSVRPLNPADLVMFSTNGQTWHHRKARCFPKSNRHLCFNWPAIFPFSIAVIYLGHLGSMSGLHPKGRKGIQLGNMAKKQETIRSWPSGAGCLLPLPDHCAKLGGDSAPENPSNIRMKKIQCRRSPRKVRSP